MKLSSNTSATPPRGHRFGISSISDLPVEESTRSSAISVHNLVIRRQSAREPTSGENPTAHRPYEQNNQEHRITQLRVGLCVESRVDKCKHRTPADLSRHGSD